MSKLKDKLYTKLELYKVGCDCMGYEFDSQKDLTLHHIKPKILGGKTSLENGSLLIRSSHNYIHIIQDYEFRLFVEISEELKKEHINGITKEQLITIRQILEYFESKYSDYCTKDGSLLIKEEFVRKRIEL